MLWRAWPDVVPSVPDVSVGQNVIDVGVLKGPQRPPARVLENQRQAWLEPVLARSTATGGARRHGVPLGPILGAGHHREGWWKADTN
jgi:hypothetical protein